MSVLPLYSKLLQAPSLPVRQSLLLLGITLLSLLLHFTNIGPWVIRTSRRNCKLCVRLSQPTFSHASKGVTVPSLSSLVCLNCDWVPGKGRGCPCLEPVTWKGYKAGLGNVGSLTSIYSPAGWGHCKD